MDGLPRACSGLRYCGVPITEPVRVSAAESPARAMPKSVIFTLRSAVTSRLAGFTSRCTIPARCATPSASPAWAIRSCTTAVSRTRPLARAVASSAESGWPSTSSMTRYGGSSPLSSAP